MSMFSVSIDTWSIVLLSCPLLDTHTTTGSIKRLKRSICRLSSQLNGQSKAFQTLGQSGVALPIQHAFGRKANGLRRSHQDRELFCSGQSCVQQVPTEQEVVLHENGENHDRKFAALALVDGYCPGQGQFREVGVVIPHLPLGELDDDFLLLQVDPGDGA